jgi:uncharacterized protein (TIGR02466 family)
MPLDKLFVTPVFHTDLPEPARVLIEHQYNEAKEAIEMNLNDSTWGDNIRTSFVSGENDFIERYNMFGLTEFTNAVVKYFHDLMFAGGEVTMFESWINYQGKHQHQRQHTHHGSVISAVYYLQSNGVDGSITFHPPMAGMELKDPSSTEWNYSMIKYPPVAGRLFVFPSWVPHSVGDNMTDDTRISIAMNFR